MANVASCPTTATVSHFLKKLGNSVNHLLSGLSAYKLASVPLIWLESANEMFEAD